MALKEPPDFDQVELFRRFGIHISNICVDRFSISVLVQNTSDACGTVGLMVSYQMKVRIFVYTKHVIY